MRWFAMVGVMLMFGCRPDDQKTETIDASQVKEARADISPESAAHLDSGNAAYKAKDYARAREHYRTSGKRHAKRCQRRTNQHRSKTTYVHTKEPSRHAPPI